IVEGIAVVGNDSGCERRAGAMSVSVMRVTLGRSRGGPHPRARGWPSCVPPLRLLRAQPGLVVEEAQVEPVNRTAGEEEVDHDGRCEPGAALGEPAAHEL